MHADTLFYIPSANEWSCHLMHLVRIYLWQGVNEPIHISYSLLEITLPKTANHWKDTEWAHGRKALLCHCQSSQCQWESIDHFVVNDNLCRWKWALKSINKSIRCQPAGFHPTHILTTIPPHIKWLGHNANRASIVRHPMRIFGELNHAKIISVRTS